MKYIGLFDEKEDIVTKEKLETKQDKITGAATTITDDNLTASHALVSDTNGKVAVSTVTSTELGYLDGVTSNVQTQLDKKLETAPVTSVNSKTGAVVLTASDVGALPADTVIPTVNNATLTIKRNSIDVGSFTANAANDVNIDINVPTNKSDIGLGNVDNVKQYSASNPPPYPVTSVNGKTGDVVLNASDVSALPNTTTIPSKTSQLTNDSGFITDKEFADKVSKSGDTMTGKLTVPQVETGDGNSNFFQCRKFRGEGNADTYYHAIDFGYKNHDQVDFHEYGGKWNFYKNQSGKVNEGVLCGKITNKGWEGGAKLTGSPTAPTPGTSDNSTRIATTAFVNSFNSTKLESNGDGSNVTAAFTAASSRTNIATGEKLSVLFGKIAKWLSDLGSLAFKSTVAKTDLASDVQTSLGKADSALQSVTKSDVGLGNVDNVKQYSASNPPPYPVTSVNGQTGAVTVTASDVGAATTSDIHTALNRTNAVNVANSNYTTYMARGEALFSAETTPTVNGTIAWQYE